MENNEIMEQQRFELGTIVFDTTKGFIIEYGDGSNDEERELLKARELIETFKKHLRWWNVTEPWITVLERMPDEGEEVIVCTESGNIYKDYCIMDYCDADDMCTSFLRFQRDDETDNVVLWQPIKQTPDNNNSLDVIKEEFEKKIQEQIALYKEVKTKNEKLLQDKNNFFAEKYKKAYADIMKLVAVYVEYIDIIEGNLIVSLPLTTQQENSVVLLFNEQHAYIGQSANDGIDEECCLLLSEKYCGDIKYSTQSIFGYVYSLVTEWDSIKEAFTKKFYQNILQEIKKKTNNEQDENNALEKYISSMQ